MPVEKSHETEVKLVSGVPRCWFVWVAFVAVAADTACVQWTVEEEKSVASVVAGFSRGLSCTAVRVSLRIVFCRGPCWLFLLTAREVAFHGVPSLVVLRRGEPGRVTREAVVFAAYVCWLLYSTGWIG